MRSEAKPEMRWRKYSKKLSSNGETAGLSGISIGFGHSG